MPDPTPTLHETREADQCLTCRDHTSARIRAGSVLVTCRHMPGADPHAANMVCENFRPQEPTDGKRPPKTPV